MIKVIGRNLSFFSVRLNVERYQIIKYFSSQLVEDERIVKSPAPNIEFPKGNFIEFLLKDYQKWQDLTALECSTTGYKITYSQLVDQSRRWSGFLKRLGIGQGDVVSVIAPNTPHFCPLFLGTGALGAVLSPINAKYTSDEMSKLIRGCRAKVLVTVPEIEPTVEEALKDVHQPIRRFIIGHSKIGLPNVVDILNEGTISFADPVELSGDEILFLPFSSGTTGFPKAVALSHNAFIANLLQFMNPYHDLVPHNAADYPQETYLAMLPFFHVYGAFLIMSIGVANGFRIATLGQFDPATFSSTIIKQKITTLHTVPTLLHYLLTRKECNAVDMKHVGTVFCGAAPVIPSSAKMFCEKLEKNVCFLEGYGMTETMITHCNPRHSNHLGTAGQLFSNAETKVVDTVTGKSLAANEPGELWLRTPSKMLLYLDNLKATSEMITNDGWIRSGDIGFYDDEGFFSISDRTKDLIKVNGLQVSPSEIEDVLASHPAVMESSVIGIPDKLRGEAPKAFVVLKSRVSEKELQKLVGSKLSKHKHLVGGVTFVDSLPKTDTGKVLKRALRDMIL